MRLTTVACSMTNVGVELTEILKSRTQAGNNEHSSMVVVGLYRPKGVRRFPIQVG